MMSQLFSKCQCTSYPEDNFIQEQSAVLRHSPNHSLIRRLSSISMQDHGNWASHYDENRRPELMIGSNND